MVSTHTRRTPAASGKPTRRPETPFASWGAGGIRQRVRSEVKASLVAIREAVRVVRMASNRDAWRHATGVRVEGAPAHGTAADPRFLLPTDRAPRWCEGVAFRVGAADPDLGRSAHLLFVVRAFGHLAGNHHRVFLRRHLSPSLGLAEKRSATRGAALLFHTEADAYLTVTLTTREVEAKKSSFPRNSTRKR
jgi:hypothetical protein